MATSKIVKFALAAYLVNTVDASAADLVQQALASVEAGSETHMHLSNALAAMDSGSAASTSQTFSVPIDEKRALALTVAPTYSLDSVNSVTLKSFRKIVGYDTFESIRRKNRNESKDVSDYYNVTVSMMVQRRPAAAASAPARDPYAPNGAPTLASTLDKGFPYDD